MITGIFFLNENVTLPHFVGAGLVVAGIALISMGK